MKVKLTEFVSFKSCVHASIYNSNVESISALKIAARIIKIGFLQGNNNKIQLIIFENFVTPYIHPIILIYNPFSLFSHFLCFSIPSFTFSPIHFKY